MSAFSSWGRNFPPVTDGIVQPRTSGEAVKAAAGGNLPVLAVGNGCSYGDSCLNRGGSTIVMSACDRFRSFDGDSGLLTVEAGVSLGEILRVAVPRGWFVPVLPGTQFVSIAGAVANDIHGKNHHEAGTFGRHVLSLSLHRSDGASHTVGAGQHEDLFAATVGGLGLTGLMSEVQIQLRPVRSAFFDVEYVPFGSLDDFFAVADDSDSRFSHTVAWVDCVNQRHRNRGVFMRGNHSESGGLNPVRRRGNLAVPLDFPSFALNRLSIGLFNEVYNWLNAGKSGRTQSVHYEDFLFPLDHVRGWNRIYGKDGFLQYQFIVPITAKDALRDIFALITRSGLGSFLAVLKKFGDLPSPGLLSFPAPGFTLALDFPNRGPAVTALFSRLDAVVAAAGGRLYPAKDSLMSEAFFKQSYPRWQEFTRWRDPGFSSDFAKRVGLVP